MISSANLPSRKEFLATVAGLALAVGESPAQSPHPPKVLLVVAHPDDEYTFSATTYRLVRELGGTADQVIITDGESGFRYSSLAESYYGLRLAQEGEGRAQLPDIRKQETLNAGKILGIRQHYFLEQRDAGFSADASHADTRNWDTGRLLSFLSDLLRREQYDFVFTLLPTEQTHGHHRAATLLLLRAVADLPEAERPVVLGSEPGRKNDAPYHFAGLPGQPLTRTLQDLPLLTFDRFASFGYRNALNYNIVVNWVIAEHKSQGLFQTDSGKHDVEQFWLFAVSGRAAAARTRDLDDRLRDLRQVTRAQR